jgi:hypothetical protein
MHVTGNERSKRLPPVLLVVLGVGSLLVVPLIAAPILFVAGLAWRTGPRWARITLTTAAILFGLYFFVTQPIGS